MDKNIFLENRLYEILYSKLQRRGSLKEKELQIVLSNVLYHDFEIKRVCHEPNYRYHDLKRGYFSDLDTDYCQDIERKQKAKRCDLRLLPQSTWIELKLNSKLDVKDIDNLFGMGDQYFTVSEDRYSINIWTKRKKLETIEINAQNVLKAIKAAPDTNIKIIQLNNKMTVAIIYKLSKKDCNKVIA